MYKIFSFTYKKIIYFALIVSIILLALAGCKLFEKETIENNYQTKTDIIIKVLEDNDDEGYRSY